MYDFSTSQFYGNKLILFTSGRCSTRVFHVQVLVGFQGYNKGLWLLTAIISSQAEQSIYCFYMSTLEIYIWKVLIIDTI